MDDVSHRLDRLLKPQSIACVGASPRPGSVGRGMVDTLVDGGFTGELRLVNPKYEEILGSPCAPSVTNLDLVPDLVIAAVGGGRVEGVVDDAIAVGAGGVVIFDSCLDHPDALERIRDKAAESGMPINGGNAMGFMNLTAATQATFYTAEHLAPGGVSLIAQSGSVFTVLALNDPRYRFNLIISAGQELGVSIDEYIDFALEQPETSVVAIFMEAARDPDRFSASLTKARERAIPVVVCKVGRTEESARLARSHTGAMAGSDAAYEALFTTHGAIRVETVDELMNVAMVLERGRTPGPGGLGVVTDSGGLRESLIDRADRRGVALADLSGETIERLQAILPPALPASNPLDCAESLTDDFAAVFRDGVRILCEAPEVAAFGYEFDGRDDHMYDTGLPAIARTLSETTAKPCFVFSSFGQANNRTFGGELAEVGVPMINGQDQMLDVVGHLFAYRDRPEDGLRTPDTETELVDRWATRVSAGRLAEHEALDMLREFGVPAVRTIVASSEPEAVAAARDLDFPVVLKSNADGLDHKTDAGAVILNLHTVEGVADGYRQLADLGPYVLVQTMAPSGVELAFGCVVDPEFGPVVMVSAGGTMIELLDDRAVALAPFGPAMAHHLIDRLRIRPLLDGYRGAVPVDIEALVEALVRFSAMCAAVSGLSEIDFNPVIVRSDGVIAVDGLVV